MIPPRAWIIPLASALILIGGPAMADDLPQGVTCDDVRNAVATLQKGANVPRDRAVRIVAAGAAAHGASPAQIEAAKRCLNHG